MDLIQTTAEEKELEEKRAELAALEEELAERELALATLKAELQAFEQSYLQVVGARYAELEEVERRVAEVMAGRPVEEEPPDFRAEGCGQTMFHPGESLKKLYRDAARLCHPDLATDAAERDRRHRLMVEVNKAYQAGSEARLQALLAAEISQTVEAPEENPSVALLMVTSKIALVRERLKEIDAENGGIESSEMFHLMRRAEKAQAAGLDFLGDLVSQVERQIKKAKNRLNWLQGFEPAA
jgi:DNA repair exonuclease SbcCD ATPase subunit